MGTCIKCIVAMVLDWVLARARKRVSLREKDRNALIHFMTFCMATIAEEIWRLRQDDRDLKQGFRNLQAKSSMIKHEGLFSGGVSLLQGEVDPKPVLSRSCKNNMKLPSLPSAN